MIAWRITKTKHTPYDATGARDWGGRWNSPGRPVIYAADTFAGAILESLAHALRPRTLPGPHHAVRIEIPDALVERLDPGTLPGWETRESAAALAFGDAWYDARRSTALQTPALPSRPIGSTLVIHPGHPDAPRITVSDPFPVPWDERLF
jgi:RES domain-containing protein